MPDKPLQVTIFGNSNSEVCLISGCGAEVTSAEMARELRETLGAMFGDRVQVYHFDLALPEHRVQFASVAAGARERNLPYPLVAINGQIVLAGRADLNGVLRKIGEVLD